MTRDTTKFIITVRIDAADDKTEILKIAARYNIDYGMTEQQVYFFINQTDILVSVASELEALIE